MKDMVDFFNDYDREQNKKLAKLPVCADCGEHILDESAFYIDGEWICEDCMDSYRMDVIIDE